jgi:hypothetical protein
MTDTDRSLCDCPEPCACYAEGYAAAYILERIAKPFSCRVACVAACLGSYGGLLGRWLLAVS